MKPTKEKTGRKEPPKPAKKKFGWSLTGQAGKAARALKKREEMIKNI